MMKVALLASCKEYFIINPWVKWRRVLIRLIRKLTCSDGDPHLLHLSLKSCSSLIFPIMKSLKSKCDLGCRLLVLTKLTLLRIILSCWYRPRAVSSANIEWMNEDTPIAVYDFVLKINHQSRESRVETWETTASRDKRQIFVVLWVVQV